VQRKEQRRVLPGELVATAEEYIAGFGTYEENGLIFSTAIGSLELDERNKIAQLIFDNPPMVACIGDNVFCEVTNARPSMVVCKLLAIDGQRRQIGGETLASLHVSKLSNGYVEDASQEIRITDIIRAEVIQAKPSIQLTSAKAYLGVVLARCKSCREPLEQKDNKLFCERCERFEHRKFAKDYRDVRLQSKKDKSPMQDKPPEEALNVF